MTMLDTYEGDLVEPSPVPPWGSDELHGQARQAVAWIRDMMDVAGYDAGVWDRREGNPYELGKLVDNLQTIARTRRLDVPGIVWTCRLRLEIPAADERGLWHSALVQAYYLTGRES